MVPKSLRVFEEMVKDLRLLNRYCDSAIHHTKVDVIILTSGDKLM